MATGNARFAIPPGGSPNLDSRVLSLCARRLAKDRPAPFGHEEPLAEPFADRALFRGTVCRAANWMAAEYVGGFAREGHGTSDPAWPKLVFLHPLRRDARARLRPPALTGHDPGIDAAPGTRREVRGSGDSALAIDVPPRQPKPRNVSRREKQIQKPLAIAAARGKHRPSIASAI